MILLHEILEKNLAIFSQKKAVICGEEIISYLELEELSNQLANALIDRGLQKLDRVAICLENSIEAVIAIFAVLKANGIFVLIHPQTKADKLQTILMDSGSNILLTETPITEQVVSLIDSQSCLIIFVQRDCNPYIPDNQKISFWTLLAHGERIRPQRQCIAQDVASLIYTSGSTGRPKGVTLTHSNMHFAADSITAYLGNTPEDVILNCLPLAFDYGLYQVLMSIKFGGTVVLEKSYLYPYQLIGLVNKEAITGLPVVPTMIAILLEYKNLEKYSLPSLRYITSTAQALPPSHLLRLNTLFPNVKIFSMYGLTECKRVSYLPSEQIHQRPNSVGKAMPNTETYLIDEAGNPINSPHKIGQLLVRGENVMQGYWNSPEDTSAVLKNFPWCPDRLLLTGDLFYFDEEGFLFFVGRKDDLIKISGEKVWPKEIEDVLYQLGDVLEAIAYSIPDQIIGQSIRAVVVLQEGTRLTEHDLQQHCNQNLEKLKVPKNIEIKKELPKTETGKLKRREYQKSNIN
jgi:long-chain acyl-CoA synthetase